MEASNDFPPFAPELDFLVARQSDDTTGLPLPISSSKQARTERTD